MAAEVLIHIARHLGHAYGFASLAPQLLVSMNKLSAAKVPAYLRQMADAELLAKKPPQSA